MTSSWLRATRGEIREFYLHGINSSQYLTPGIDSVTTHPVAIGKIQPSSLHLEHLAVGSSFVASAARLQISHQLTSG